MIIATAPIDHQANNTWGYGLLFTIELGIRVRVWG